MDQDPDNLNAPDLEHGKHCCGQDPGSGVFLAPGSGIRIPDGKISGSGMNKFLVLIMINT
jgi:hypothetical protein